MSKLKGSKCYMTFKIDLEKVYDKLNWNFIRWVLKVARFLASLISTNMQYVLSSSMTVLWNGDRLEPFQPSRGVRQGDGLCPYLFVLYIEHLAHLIRHSSSNGTWKPLPVSRRGPLLTHSMFVDDTVLFVEALDNYRIFWLFLTFSGKCLVRR